MNATMPTKRARGGMAALLGVLVSLVLSATCGAAAAYADVFSATVEPAASLEAGETYVIVSADKSWALSSEAGNAWGSTCKAVAVTVADDEAAVSSEEDLQKCLWAYDEDGYLCNQGSVYVNLMNGGPYVKPEGTPGATWSYSQDDQYLTSGDTVLRYDASSEYFNGVQTNLSSNHVVHLYKVVDAGEPGQHVHSYTGVVTVPTCTEQGYTTYVCSCGESYVDDYVDALGHDWGEWKYSESSYDYEHYRSCQRCQAHETGTCVNVLQETVAPTCGARGYERYECETCGHSVHANRTEATGDHDYRAVSLGNGKGVHQLTCEVCGISIYGDCTWDEGVVTTEATADTDGEITYTCTVCGDTRVATVPSGGGFAEDAQGNYLISSADDLKALARLVNDGNIAYAGASYRLTRDIQLEGEWTPIGVGSYLSDTAFSGTFDGGQHTISGLSVTAVADNRCHGLFGVVSGTVDKPAVVKNLAVEGSIVNASDSVVGSGAIIGGVVGAATGSVELTACASHVKISNSFRYATGSYYTGAVSSYVGGLVGYAYSNEDGQVLYLDGCYADANVGNENVNATYAGYSHAYVGGLVGGAYHYSGWISLKNSFANMDKISVSNTAYAKDSDGAMYRYGDTIMGTNTGTITTQENLYYAPGLASSSGTSDAVYVVGASTTNASARAITVSLMGAGYKANADGKVVFAWEPDSPGESSDSQTHPETGWFSASADEFVLAGENDLLGFAQLVGEGQTFAGKTVKLSGNVELSEGSPFAGIGNEQHPFAGTFDGQGFCVAGLALEGDESTSHLGFFGYLDSAVVKGLTVAGSVSGGDYTGGIAGRTLSSTILDCGNDASVSGRGHVGGIVGALTSNVNGDPATVAKSYNKGSVANTSDAMRRTGGIAGEIDPFSYVTACYNRATVQGGSAGSGYTGGIVGMCTSGTVQSCYNSGTVTGTDGLTGALAGAGNTAAAGNDFYLEGSAASEIGSAVSAAVLKGADIIEKLNKGMTAFQPSCGGYPVMTWETSTGHLYGDWARLDDGHHRRVCSRDTSHEEVAEHTWDAGMVTRQATETAEGEIRFACTVCGAVKTETVPKVQPSGGSQGQGGTTTGGSGQTGGLTTGTPAKSDGSAGTSTSTGTKSGASTSTTTSGTAASGTKSGTTTAKSGASTSGAKASTSKPASSAAKKAPAAQKLSVKGKAKTVKLAKLKKKAQSVKKAITVKGAKTKVTYKITKATKGKKSFKKKFSVTKKGVIKVKKGLKKGTYTLKVKVTAAKSASYKAATKTATVKIKVK